MKINRCSDAGADIGGGEAERQRAVAPPDGRPGDLVPVEEEPEAERYRGLAHTPRLNRQRGDPIAS